MRKTPDHSAADTDTRIFRTCSMHLSGTEAIALSVSEAVPHVRSRHNIRKAYQSSNQNAKRSMDSPLGVDSAVRARKATKPDSGTGRGSKAIKLSLIKRLHTNSNAGLVSIRDVYNAVDDLLS